MAESFILKHASDAESKDQHMSKESFCKPRNIDHDSRISMYVDHLCISTYRISRRQQGCAAHHNLYRVKLGLLTNIFFSLSFCIERVFSLEWSTNM